MWLQPYTNHKPDLKSHVQLIICRYGNDKVQNYAAVVNFPRVNSDILLYDLPVLLRQVTAFLLDRSIRIVSSLVRHYKNETRESHV